MNIDCFLTKVDKSDPAGCWVSVVGGDGRGYGQVRLNGRRQKAHRVSWELEYGSIPPGLCVLHKCDTPRCIRPDHLFLGTKGDNYLDMKIKGRQHFPGPIRPASGELNGRAKLTESIVREIRRLKAARGLSNVLLGKMFGVTDVAISCIFTGRTWGHVT